MSRTMTINGVNFSLVTGKKAELIVSDYRYAERRGDTQLHHVYGRYSYAKERAFEDCDFIRGKVGGGTMYISGHNCCTFTLVYLLKHAGKSYIVKETHCNRYIAEVELGDLR